MQTTEITTDTNWGIDKVNSQIGFSTKYLLFSTVRGSFKEFDATITTREDDFSTAEIHCWINAASIDTGVEQRDIHLKKPDFFDVEKFSMIHFRSESFFRTDKPNLFDLYGELTIKNVKKEIKLNVESGGIVKDPWGTEKALFSITGKINRSDFGLNWNAALETGGFLVSEEVLIHAEILLTSL
jgi:polyisoprenoid-binding protein YceI